MFAGTSTYSDEDGTTRRNSANSLSPCSGTIEPIDCDRSRIAQLFSNLLGNALSYGAPNQPVRVRAVYEAGSFELSISNTGEPIPPAALERLF